jgi:protein-disulfide isomerase
LDLEAFRQALDTRRYEADVDADVELGHRVHAADRPSLFVNGKRVDVPFGVAELKELIESLSAQHP